MQAIYRQKLIEFLKKRKISFVMTARLAFIKIHSASWIAKKIAADVPLLVHRK